MRPSLIVLIAIACLALLGDRKDVDVKAKMFGSSSHSNIVRKNDDFKDEPQIVAEELKAEDLDPNDIEHLIVTFTQVIDFAKDVKQKLKLVAFKDIDMVETGYEKKVGEMELAIETAEKVKVNFNPSQHYPFYKEVLKHIKRVIAHVIRGFERQVDKLFCEKNVNDLEDTLDKFTYLHENIVEFVEMQAAIIGLLEAMQQGHKTAHMLSELVRAGEKGVEGKIANMFTKIKTKKENFLYNVQKVKEGGIKKIGGLISGKVAGWV